MQRYDPRWGCLLMPLYFVIFSWGLISGLISLYEILCWLPQPAGTPFPLSFWDLLIPDGVILLLVGAGLYYWLLGGEKPKNQNP